MSVIINGIQIAADRSSFVTKVVLNDGTKYCLLENFMGYESQLFNQLGAKLLHSKVKTHLIRRPTMSNMIAYQYITEGVAVGVIGGNTDGVTNNTMGTVQNVLNGLNITETVRDTYIHLLSIRWQLCVDIARALCTDPKILLVDVNVLEQLPLNSVIWLIGVLKKYPGILIVKSSDRTVVNELADYILTIDDYKEALVYSKGGYHDYEIVHDRRHAEKIRSFKANLSIINAHKRLYRSKAPKLPKSLHRAVVGPIIGVLNTGFGAADELISFECTVEGILGPINAQICCGDKIILAGQDTYKNMLVGLIFGHIMPTSGSVYYSNVDIGTYPKYISGEESLLKVQDYLLQFCHDLAVIDDILALFGLAHLSYSKLYLLPIYQSLQIQLISVLVCRYKLLIIHHSVQSMGLLTNIILSDIISTYAGAVIISTNSLDIISCKKFRVFDINAERMDTMSAEEYIDKHTVHANPNIFVSVVGTQNA
jgi:ATPase subunit of ABC transporter with duplicated ATPase domains